MRRVEPIEKIAAANGGFITASEASTQGIQRRTLSAATKAGTLIKIDRGLYCLPNTWEDEYVIAQHRFSRGIFSHDTALYLLNLSDQTPETLTMTFPKGYNTSSARKTGLITKSAPKNRFDLGTIALRTPYGNNVTAYNAERTLCDMMRGTANPDKQILIPALKHYLSRKGRNVAKLQDCARDLGVDTKMRAYLEVLL